MICQKILRKFSTPATDIEEPRNSDMICQKILKKLKAVLKRAKRDHS